MKLLAAKLLTWHIQKKTGVNIEMLWVGVGWESIYSLQTFLIHEN